MQLTFKMPFVHVNKTVKKRSNFTKHIKNKSNALLLSSHSNASMYILYMNGGLFKKKL